MMMVCAGVKETQQHDEINHRDDHDDRGGKIKNQQLCFAAGLVLLSEEIHNYSSHPELEITPAIKPTIKAPPQIKQTPGIHELENAYPDFPHARSPMKAPKIAPQKKCIPNLNQSYFGVSSMKHGLQLQSSCQLGS